MRVAGHGFRWESLRLASLGFAAHVPLYRLLKGRFVGRNILILTTIGRRTGRRRSTPLYYVSDEDGYVVIASNGGEDRYPGWWYNIQANPERSRLVRFASSAEPIGSASKRTQNSCSRNSAPCAAAIRSTDSAPRVNLLSFG